MYKNCSSVLLIAALLLQSTGCGTILHPERKGQKAGKIDTGIAVLDGIGLLFFIIPGGNGKGLLNRNDLEKTKFEPGTDTKARIEMILRQKTGLDIRLDRPGMEVSRLKSIDELPSTEELALYTRP